MQPHNPMLDTYRKHTAIVRNTMDSTLQRVEGESTPKPVRTARRSWEPVSASLETIDQMLADLGEAVFAIAINRDLTEEAKGERYAGQAQVARSALDGTTGEILRQSNEILAQLRTAAYPARPDGEIAAQEAALANIKADLRMVLDPLSDGMYVTQKLGAQLSRALMDGDVLASWLLASTRWPADYLDSRGAGDFEGAWDATVGDTLDAVADGDLAKVRRVYRAVASYERGLPLLETLFVNLLPGIVNDLIGWRPSTWEPVPFTRFAS